MVANGTVVHQDCQTTKKLTFKEHHTVINDDKKNTIQLAVKGPK